MSESFKIKIKEHNIVFLQSDKNVLNALERENIETHYHCRDGFCGACRCKLIKGSVKYINEPLAYIDDGEFLTCCAYPTSDIYIEED